MARVSVTRIRPELNRWIEHVRDPEQIVVLTSHGREVAALVSALRSRANPSGVATCARS